MIPELFLPFIILHTTKPFMMLNQHILCIDPDCSIFFLLQSCLVMFSVKLIFKMSIPLRIILFCMFSRMPENPNSAISNFLHSFLRWTESVRWGKRLRCIQSTKASQNMASLFHLMSALMSQSFLTLHIAKRTLSCTSNNLRFYYSQNIVIHSLVGLRLIYTI